MVEFEGGAESPAETIPAFWRNLRFWLTSGIRRCYHLPIPVVGVVRRKAVNRSMLTVTTLSAVAGLLVCGCLSPGFGLPAAAADQAGGKAETPLKLGEERIPAGEDATIKALVELQVAIMKKG